MDENLNEMNAAENAEVTPIEDVTPTEPAGVTDEPVIQEGGSRKGPGAGIWVILVAILALVVVGVALATGASASNGRFVDAASDDYIFNMQNEMLETMTKDGTHEIKYTLDIVSLLAALDYDGIKFEDISFANTLVKDGEDGSGRASFLYGDESLIAIDYAKTGDLYGINVPDLFEKFVVIENNNLKALAEKFDLDSENVPDKLTEEYILELMAEDIKEAEKYEEIIKPYLDLIEDSIKSNTVTTKKQSIEINGTTLETTKHAVTLSEKEAILIFADILEEAADDKDFYEIIIEESPELAEYTFEEYKDELKLAVEQMVEMSKNANADEKYEVSVYVDGKNTVAFEVAETEVDAAVRVAGINDKKSSYIEVAVIVPTEDIKVSVQFVTTKADNYTGDVKVMVTAPSMTMTVDVMEYEYAYNKKVDGKVTLKADECLVLNTAEDSEIEALGTEIMGNADAYVEAISDKVPDDVVEFVTDFVDSMSSSSIYDDYDYDYDYEDDYDYDYDYDYDVTFESKVKVLPELNGMYSKVSIGMGKDALMTALGDYDDKDEFYGATYYTWESEADDYMYVTVVVEDDVVTSKEIYAYSSSYGDVALSQELNATIADLDAVIDSVEEGMTLSEVKAILGNACFESSSDEYGYTDYTWYDTAENYVEISFNENNRADYVGTVWGSY